MVWIHLLSFDGPLNVKLVALINLAISLPLLYFCTREFFTRRPRLVLNHLGISDYRFGVGTIQWNEVTQLRLISFRGSSIMKLSLSTQFRFPPLRGFVARLTGDNSIYLPLGGLNIDPIDIYKFAITKAPGGWA